MSDVTALVDDYIAVWNETDPQARRALIERTFAADASYVDPLMAGAGREEIDALVAGAQSQYPAHEFRLAGGPDIHHDRVRFSWTLHPESGAAIAVGTDFATLDGDGRLRDVTGFLEAPAA
jgi:hypothetical protein